MTATSSPSSSPKPTIPTPRRRAFRRTRSPSSGRHAAIQLDEPQADVHEPVAVPEDPVAVPEDPVAIPEDPVAIPEDPVAIPEDEVTQDDGPEPQTAIHLPLADPYLPPTGYPIKADTKSGMYWAPETSSMTMSPPRSTSSTRNSRAPTGSSRATSPAVRSSG